MQMDRIELRRLARIGAHARLQELEQERVQILRAFPELGRGPANARTASPERPRRNYNMSAAQRRAVSARMKKYWAERRKNSAR